MAEPTEPNLSSHTEILQIKASSDHAPTPDGRGYDTDNTQASSPSEKPNAKVSEFLRGYAQDLTASCLPENVTRAVQLLEKQIKEGSPTSEDYSVLAETYGRAGKYQDTLTAYKKALTLDPTNTIAQVIKIPDGDEPIHVRQKKRAEEIHQQGRQLLYAKNKPLEALRYYEAAVALAGKTEASWSIFDKGKALAELGHTDQAIQALQQSRFLMPNSTWPSSQLGIVYEKAGKLELARDLFYEALEKDNKNDEAIAGLTRIGISYEVMKHLKEARATYRETLNRDHGNQEAKRRLEAVGNVNGIGLLNWEVHKKRRSETLRILPDAELDEQFEAQRYIDSLPENYREELSHLDAQIGKPMSEACRAAIVIPAYHEGKVIKRSLEHFLNQTDKEGKLLDPSLFEIIVVDNHPSDNPKDNTESEIRTFKEEHPEMRISYVHKTWTDNEGCVGNARRYGLDLAVMRGLTRSPSAGELFLVNNDADIYGISPTYISTIINEFDKNPKLDALTGKWTLPEQYLTNPNLKAAQRMKYILDLVMMSNYIPGKDKYPANPPNLQGKSSAYRTSIYTGVGGMNQYATLAEDLEVGWMIRNARGWDGSTQKFISGKSMEMVSDPRRFLSVMSEGIPLANMYDGFHENTRVREMNNDELFTAIPKHFDKKIIEREADALWQKQNSEYDSQKQNFYSFFDRTMRLMGLEYEIVDMANTDGEITSHIRILDSSRLEHTLTTNQSASPEEEKASTPIKEVSPFASEKKVQEILNERQKKSDQLYAEGKTLLEFRQEFDNDYSTLEDYYRERAGVDLISDPYESADVSVPISKTCSIVLPTYKRTDALKRSLMSLQESTFNAKYPQQLEAIIMDDGTPEEEGSKTIAQTVEDMQLKDLNVKVFRQTNGRISKARYSGVLRATGDVVIITDPDVVYTPTTIEEFMKRHEILEGIALFGLRANIDPNDPRISIEGIKNGKLAELPYTFAQDSRVTNNAMVDSGFLKRAGHNITLPMDADYGYYGWTIASSAWGLSVSAPREAFLKTMAGLEERYVGWGYDDEHMVSELIAAGLFVIPNTGGMAYHQDHPSAVDEARREINKEIFKSNLSTLPRFQDPASPLQTDAHLVLEVQNSRTENKNIPIPSGNEYKRALTQASIGLYDKAIATYETILPQNKDNLWFLYDYASALISTSRSEDVIKAINLLQKCTTINPQESWIHSALGQAYGRIGKYEKGLQAYTKAQELNANNPVAAILGSNSEDPDARARSRKETGTLLLKRNKPREALSYLDAAIMLSGEINQSWAVFDKGKALFQLGLYKEASIQVQRAAQLMPQETWPYSQMGIIYETTGNLVKARDFYEQALARNSGNHEARSGLTRLSANTA